MNKKRKMVITLILAGIVFSCTDSYYKTEKLYLEQNYEVIELQSGKDIELLQHFSGTEVFL
jgi:hypothetical protein